MGVIATVLVLTLVYLVVDENKATAEDQMETPEVEASEASSSNAINHGVTVDLDQTQHTVTIVQ